MADSAVAISAGVGTNIDTRTMAGGDHRQVIVIGDPTTNANVALVDVLAGLTVNAVPHITGGCLSFHLVAANGTNPTNVKPGPGQLYGALVSNRATYAVSVHLHNNVGTPSAGTAVFRTISVQAGTDLPLSYPRGITFSSGIAITITKLHADADTTVVVAGDCVVDLEYK